MFRDAQMPRATVRRPGARRKETIMKRRRRARAWTCLAGLCGGGVLLLSGCTMLWIEQGLSIAEFLVQALLLGAVNQ